MHKIVLNVLKVCLMGKQKTPGGIPCRVFCFTMGKQKILGDVYSNLNLKILKNRQNEV